MMFVISGQQYLSLKVVVCLSSVVDDTMMKVVKFPPMHDEYVVIDDPAPQPQVCLSVTITTNQNEHIRENIHHHFVIITFFQHVCPTPDSVSGICTCVFVYLYTMNDSWC